MWPRKKNKETIIAGTINTQGDQFPQRDMQPTIQMQQPPIQPVPPYIPPPPPPKPATPAELQTFIDHYRIFAPESFNAPGVYEAMVCNLLYGIYAELYKVNRE